MKNYLQRANRNNSVDFFDEAFSDFFRPLFYDDKFDVMKTDIKETDKNYELEVEMPGFNKEDISMSLDNGYVVISAEKKETNEDKNDKNVRYLRKERSISQKRSYYVGDVKEENVKAKYDNGVLSVIIPKEQPKVESQKRIMIE